MGYLIFDGKGYWVSRRRLDGRVLEFWSPRKQDAAVFHFLEVAKKIAKSLPQQTEIRLI